MREAGQSLLGEDRLSVLCKALEDCLLLGGEVWECGVYSGGSALWMARTIESFGWKTNLRLFDTFEGIALAEPMLDNHKDGDFDDVDLASVRELFKPFSFVSIHPGVFPKTFEGFGATELCFVHIDCDVYRSIHACLHFCWPRLKCGGKIVLDDYYEVNCPGAKQAVDDFLFVIKGQFTQTDGVHPQLILQKK